MIWKWGLGIVGVLATIAALICGVGALLPLNHVSRAERLIPLNVEAVAARIWNVRAYPSWRGDIDLEIVGEDSDGVSYVETQDGERIAYRLTEPEPSRRFVATLTDQSLPFGGHWNFTLTPQGEATLVQIEEAGEIRDPLYRFFARFVFGYTSTMEGYLDKLEASA